MAQLSYWKVLTRRKAIEAGSETDSKLHRVMGTFDLTALGVGATLGVGVYVLAGHVAKDQAGPSVVLSFAIAAIASLFAGLCYAEFGARVPRAGSAYIYSYVCIGEFAAFVIGWNLILEYIIGSASVARGLSLYLDSLLNNTMQTAFRDVAPIDWGFLGTYFDFFAFGSAFLLGVALAFGLKQSTLLNNCFTVLNVAIVLIVIVAGSIKSNIKNWEIPASDLPQNSTAGAGGFFPYGFEGTIRGAATCFFGFVGFDCIATTGEEVKNPRKAIPRAIMFSLLIIFLAYFGVSTVLTLMWPYYLQNVNAPLPYVFEQIGWPVVQWIVTIGGMIGLVASMFGAMFPLPRIMYAMSQDGLIFHFFGEISPRFKTPIAGTICAALLTGLMAAIFDLRQLVNMLSIGTLMAYTVVAISITILRHMNDDSKQGITSEMTEGTNLVNHQNERINTSSLLIQIFNCRRVQIPSVLSSRVVGTLLLFYCAFCFGFSFTFLYATQEIRELKPWPIAIGCLFLALILILLLAISVQPRENANSTFTVPLVPLIPGISIFINVYLMLQLDIYTWIRFGVWMVIGLPIYLICICLYNRTEEKTNRASSITYRGTSFDDFVPPQVDVEKSMPNGTIHSNAETLSIKTIEETNGIIPMNGKITEETQRVRPASPKGSLDEIIPASELSGTVREIRTPNGNTLFIEDINPTSPSIADEDAKSVLAILDDVLKVEDSSNRDLYRSTSTVSEQLPSSIETAAIIHNSFEDLPEEEVDVNHNTKQTPSNEVEEDKTAPNEKLPVLIAATPLKVDDKQEEGEDVCPPEPKPDYPGAPDFDDTFDETIDAKHSSDDETPPPVPPRDDISPLYATAINFVSDTPADQAISEAARRVSATKTPSSSIKSSRRSSGSSEDILVTPSRSSQKFRDRLSKMIINPPTFVRIKRAEETLNETTNDNGEITPPLTSYPMKQSKSESDLVHMKSADDEATPGAQNGDKDNEENENNIPKAPKFDPVLYKTIASRYKNQRPKLDLTVSDDPDQPVIRPKTAPIIVTQPSEDEDEPNLEVLPFREKLAALLKRGPSHRTKIRPDSYPKLNPHSRAVTPEPSETNSISDPNLNSERRSRSPSPLSNPEANTDDHKQKFTQVLQSITGERGPPKKKAENQESIQEQPSERPATIEEALKRLRHVRQPVELD